MPPAEPQIGDDGRGEQQHDHADRQVHEEDVAPVERGHQQAAEGRPGDRRHSGDGAPDAERGTPTLRREDVRDDRQGLRHQHRRAQALNRAEGDQPARIRREPAGGRRGGEQGDAGREHDPRPDEVAQPARRDHQDREHQGIGVDHPEHVVQRRVQLRDHVRDRDVDDREVQQGHEEPERDHQQDRPRIPSVLPHVASSRGAYRAHPVCASPPGADLPGADPLCWPAVLPCARPPAPAHPHPHIRTGIRL